MNENDKDILTWGDRIYLKNDEGPIAFGYVTSAAVVSWSGGDSRDLITSRMGGVNLYPSKELNGTEQNREPAVVCETGFGMSRAFPVDWDKDGKDDLIVTDTAGFIYLYKRKGEYPDLSFEFHSMLRDKKSGLPFNIPLG